MKYEQNTEIPYITHKRKWKKRLETVKEATDSKAKPERYLSVQHIFCRWYKLLKLTWIQDVRKINICWYVKVLINLQHLRFVQYQYISTEFQEIPTKYWSIDENTSSVIPTSFKINSNYKVVLRKVKVKNVVVSIMTV